MAGNATLTSLLEKRRRLIEGALDDALAPEGSWPEILHRAVRYSIFAGGKRIRPLLVLAAGEAVGGSGAELLPLACAVEMIHTYSLIHDDLPAMDNDDLRRGKPTAHKVFGEAVAILAGDALLTRAFHVMAEIAADSDLTRQRRRLGAMALLGEACGASGLIGGQVEDLASQGRRLAPQELERVHRAKTGALLSACVRGGALLGGAGPEDTEALARYGAAVGLGFQIVDDILDETGSAEQLGKTAGKDREARKATYVAVHGLDGARQKASALLAEALEALAPLGGRGELLAAIAGLIHDRRA